MIGNSSNQEVVSVSPREDNKEKAETQTKQEYNKIIKKLKRALLVDALSASEFKGFYELTQILDKFPPVVLELMTDFLDYFALETSVKIMPPLLTVFTPEMKEKRQVQEILPHVFSANTQGIGSLFDRKEGAPHPKILLKKASYDEGYFSRKLNKFVCFRRWKSVSPLQAAYLCGDGPFLGRKLLAYILTLPPDIAKPLLAVAQQQLEELLNRPGMNAEKTSANNTAVVVSAAAPTENEFADNAEFLAPIKELIKAYDAYLSRCSLRMWNQVSEFQKRLSSYVKQEFFRKIPFHPLPEFNTEPDRVECRDQHNNLLDLDEFGIGSDFGIDRVCAYGFIKGMERRCLVGEIPIGFEILSGGLHPPVYDWAAMSHLCKLREVDLRNTVECLQSLERARILIAKATPTQVANVTSP